MAEQFVNDFQTTLTSGINDVTTTIPVAAGTSVASQFRAKIDDEIIIVTAGGTGTSWTATRGAEGTSNVSHSSGATVTIVLTDGALDTWGSELFSSRQVRDGLATQYDPTPSSSNTEDDEFNTASLDAKWTVVTNTAASVDYDTTWQSHAFIEFDGDQDYEITQSYAPAGDFSITCSYTVAGTTNFQQAVLAAHDNNATPGAGDSVYIDYLYTTGHVIRLIRVDGGGASVIVNYSVPGVNRFYLHLQRVGSTWSAWFSFNALSWFRIATTSKSFTVDKIGLLMQQGGATTPVLFGVDWIRRDWITL